jgi:sugar phosphate isomerase/epimerase
MKLGIVGLMPPDLRQVNQAVARRIREHGFTGVSCVLANPLEWTEPELARISPVLADEGITVAQTNPRYEALVNPDDAARAEGIRVLSHACRCARWLGCDNVYVRPGSLNPRGHWTPHPENTHPRTIDRLVASLRAVAPAAEAAGVVLAIEGHVVSPLNTAESVRDVIEAVGSPALRFNMDPVNFIGTLHDAYYSGPFVEHLFDVLGTHTVCAHIKDLVVEDRLVLHLTEAVPGAGLLDQAWFLRLYERYCPDRFALIEHLPDDKVPAAKAAMDRAAAEAGAAWSE